jgi:hypothetical protein
LWSFTSDTDLYWRQPLDFAIIDHLSQAKAIKTFYKTFAWSGCFGVMSIINWSQVDYLDQKYDFFRIMLEHIRTRENRMCLERIWACLCWMEFGPIPIRWGNIRDYCQYGMTWRDYRANKRGQTTLHQLQTHWTGFMPLGFLFYQPRQVRQLPAIKVWTGR